MIISVPLPLSPSFLSSFPLAAPRSPASLLITIGDSCHLLFHHFSSRTFCICLRRPSPGCALSVLFRVIYTAVCSAGSRLSACGCFCLCCSPRLISSAAVWRTSVMPPRYMQSERHIYEVTMITPRGSYAFNPVMATCFFRTRAVNHANSEPNARDLNAAVSRYPAALCVLFSLSVALENVNESQKMENCEKQGLPIRLLYIFSITHSHAMNTYII